MYVYIKRQINYKFIPTSLFRGYRTIAQVKDLISASENNS